MNDEQARDAEMTLVTVTQGMTEQMLDRFLEQMGVLRGEYDYLCKKYAHLIRRYNDEKQSAGSSAETKME